MGLIGAVGALGGVGINLAFRQSFLSYGSGTGAFVAFLAFYAACFAGHLGRIPSPPGRRAGAGPARRRGEAAAQLRRGVT